MIPDEAHWVGVNKITFYFLIPSLIITTMVQTEIADLPVVNIVMVLAIALTLVMSVLAVVYFVAPKTTAAKTTAAKSSFSSTFQTATRWNAAIALAITGEIYGPVAVTVIALAMIVLIPVINIVNVALLANLLAERRISLLESFVKIITNPIIIGCFCGHRAFHGRTQNLVPWAEKRAEHPGGCGGRAYFAERRRRLEPVKFLVGAPAFAGVVRVENSC